MNELNLDDGINKSWDWASLWNASTNKRLDNSLKNLKKGVSSKVNIDGYWSLYLYPFVQISSTGGLSFAIQTFDPLDNPEIEITTFNTTLYSPILKDNSIGNSLISFYKSVSELNYKVFSEDAEICSKVPLSSWDFSPLKYSSHLEKKVDHFKKCCRKVINL